MGSHFHQSLNMSCMFVPPAGKNDCPIDVYFTIDTSETIALQEPPPGSLVESIKVAFYPQFHDFNRKFCTVIAAKHLSIKFNSALFIASDSTRTSPDSLCSVWTMRSTEVLCGSTGTSEDCISPNSKECLAVLDPKLISLM